MSVFKYLLTESTSLILEGDRLNVVRARRIKGTNPGTPAYALIYGALRQGRPKKMAGHEHISGRKYEMSRGWCSLTVARVAGEPCGLT